jgi:hypothetical protein
LSARLTLTPKPHDLSRRDFLRGAAGLAVGRPEEITTALPPVPRVNGAINLQPVRRFDPNAGLSPPLINPILVDLQLRTVYQLGFAQIRLTLSFDRFGPDFFAAIPYVRAARALGIDVLGIIGQFSGFDLAQALSRYDTREEVLEVYLTIFDDAVVPASAAIEKAGVFSAQVLNEPTHFLGIPPSAYVREFLAPAYDHLKEDDPQIIIVSAAEIGRADGLLRMREMMEAGLERFCDRVAYHVYDRRLIPGFAGMASKPVWITESGVPGTANHLAWVAEVFEEMRAALPEAERIYYFDLYDTEPGRFRLIDIQPHPEEGFRVVAESTALYRHFRERVSQATGGAPHATYDSLIPDITFYFPTEHDRRLVASTSFGLRF